MVDVVVTGLQAQLPEIHVTGTLNRLPQIDLPMRNAIRTIPFAAPQFEVPGAEINLGRWNFSRHEGCHGHDGFKGAARGVVLVNRPVDQGLAGILQQLAVNMTNLVQVEARKSRQAEHMAVVGIDNTDRAELRVQHPLGQLLNAGIKRELYVASVLRHLLRDDTMTITGNVHPEQLSARFSTQNFIVHLLKTASSIHLVFIEVVTAFFFASPQAGAHMADHMASHLPVRVFANRLGIVVNARHVANPLGKAGNCEIIEVLPGIQRQHALLPHVPVNIRPIHLALNLQGFCQFIDQAVYALDRLLKRSLANTFIARINRNAMTGPVVRQANPVAIKHPTPPTGNPDTADALMLDGRRIVMPLDNLEIPDPVHNNTHQPQHGQQEKTQAYHLLVFGSPRHQISLNSILPSL